MDVYTQQLMALSAKIDTLYQLVDQIHTQIAEASVDSNHQRATEPAPIPESVPPPSTYHALYVDHPYALELEHRDILVDNDYVQIDNQNGDLSMTTEVQVQRLTAQLTAAYNRIAALEEQLLARRVHSH
ncbi:hypothetical protein [Trichothermofontia sp.]